MRNGPISPSQRDEERSARIRQLREQREGPMRRRRALQPFVLIGWFAAVAALAAVLIYMGFLAFSPTLMNWVEENPGSIDHGIVRDFVEWYEPEALADQAADPNSDERITFTVVPGMSDRRIGEELHAAGLIRNQLSFYYALVETGRQGTLAAGTYDLSPSLSPSEIIATLRGVRREEVTITIREGWRLEEIVAYLATTRLTMSIDEFAAIVTGPPPELLNRYDFFRDLPQNRTLEGYLYPDTYNVFANATALEVVQLLLDAFDAQLTAEVREALAAGGMAIDNAVILASIVEREAVVEDERPLIAGVYLNRLRDDSQTWVLNADPTLQYGLATAEHGDLPVSAWGDVNWWPQLQVGGSEVELPEELAGYQTYRNAGIPPSPIASPRSSSIRAVAFPDVEQGYFFFVAACPDGVRDGSHRFSVTLAEHEANIALAREECPPE
jgi:UPF0755 protein